MRLKKVHWIGIVFGTLCMILNLIFFMNIFGIEAIPKNMRMFWFLSGICAVVVASPFFVLSILKSGKEKEKEEMFLELSRNLVESVKSGTPISESIIHMKGKNYGSLTPHVNKLANQISLGIPVSDALDVFVRDIGNRTIGRAIDLIKEAEKAGGDIGNILSAVAKSLSEIDELKKERRSVIYTVVVQGYIIFFVFIIIMLVMQFAILPMTSGISAKEGVLKTGVEGLETGLEKPQQIGGEELYISFLLLLIVQGFFAGLITGQLAEGNIKAGIKHSFILIVLALLISTGAGVILG